MARLVLTQDSGESRGSSGVNNNNELGKLLKIYKEQNRILRECNLKLEKALDAVTQTDNTDQSKTITSSLFDSARDAVLLYDKNGTIIDANRSSVALFGLSKNRMIGRSVSSLISIDQRRYLASNLNTACATGSASFELKFKRHDGCLIYLDVGIEFLDTRKQSLRLMARDITNVVKTREQLLRSRVFSSLGEMMAGIAHEVNNPLGVILLYSELLLKNSDPEQTQRDLKIIHGEAKRAVRILSALLTYTRKVDLGVRKVDLSRVIRGAVRMRNYTHKVGNISHKITLPECPLYVIGNVPQLAQVFTNIILNAEDILKKQDGGIIAITALAQESKAVVKIADNGTGISPQHIDKIFFPFYSTRETGSGLGLSTCYGIVTALNGTIYAENNDTGGATFVVELPLWRQNEKTSS